MIAARFDILASYSVSQNMVGPFEESSNRPKRKGVCDVPQVIDEGCVDYQFILGFLI